MTPGIPEGTLSSRLTAGRKKLAARLTKGRRLSVAVLPIAIAKAQATVAVPNELLTKTSGLVADWVTGGAVPGSLARLAEGGFTVRKFSFSAWSWSLASPVRFRRTARQKLRPPNRRSRRL